MDEIDMEYTPVTRPLPRPSTVDLCGVCGKLSDTTYGHQHVRCRQVIALESIAASVGVLAGVNRDLTKLESRVDAMQINATSDHNRLIDVGTQLSDLQTELAGHYLCIESIESRLNLIDPGSH